MKKDLSKIKSFIEKYNIKCFNNEKEIRRWISKLSQSGYDKLTKLTIDPKEIEFDSELLINKDLLECKDYHIRVEAMSKIKNCKECKHLLKQLCLPKFLNSKNYYLDMAILAKAKYIRYCLWLLNEDKFLNSKHHIDDLNAVAKAKDEITAQVLAEVAMDADSLQSKYHRKDMEIIAECDSKNLQPTNQYPASSVNNLAINKISLQDPFHTENMQILAKNKKSKGYLYNLMTNQSIIYNENYRREVSRLNKAKTRSKARAIYYFITNPERTCTHDFFDKMIDQEMNIDYSLFDRTKCVKGNQNPRYNFYLKLLNEIPDTQVMYIEYLVSNKSLLESGHLDKDVRFLLTMTNKRIFIDLFYLMQNEQSLNTPHHENDVMIISRTEDDKKRKLLLRIATSQNNLLSQNHQYDMLFVSSLNLDNIPENNLDALYYYLFNSKGINNPNHIEILEDIYKGIELENVFPQEEKQTLLSRIFRK